MSITANKQVLSGKSDVEVTFEDQQKINEFARLNTRLEEVKVLFASKKKELLNLEEGIDEMLMQDDALPVPLLIGEAFINYEYDAAHLLLEDMKDNLTIETTDLLKEEEELREKMAKLKIDLYAKFGSSINLEADDDSA